MGRMFCCVLVGLLVIQGGIPLTAQASGEGPERTLWVTAEQLRNVVAQLRTDLSEERLATTALARLRVLGETLQASDLLMKEHLRIRGDGLQGAAGEGRARHLDATARYAAAMARLLESLGTVLTSPALTGRQLDALLAALDELAPPRHHPLHGLLPYRQPGFPPRLPVAAPLLMPAYHLAVPPLALPADLAGSPEAPVSAAIVSQARAIAAAAGRTHWDPATMYNWVRENIRTEWYWGSMKGAEETLRQRSGNDADQAALLIALLRAGGYPARYVRGTIEFFPGLDAALMATGINDPEQLPAFFQGAGIPCEAIRAGGRLVSLRIEHLWVEALVPYANYRGMVADASGQLWIPLDTSLKTGGYEEAVAIDLSAQPGNPLPGFRDRYLAAPREAPPRELLRQETELFLATDQPGRTFADTLHTRRQRPAPLSILPSVPQFVEVAVIAEYAALPLELHHQVHLRAVMGDPAGALLFDLTVPLRQLSNRRVMIGFEPETVADQEQVNLWGGLDNTPAYLVRLRPVVIVDGERLAVATSGLAVGANFTLNLDFVGPSGSASVSDSVPAGYPLLLGIVAQQALPPDRTTLAASAAELLHRAALAYIDAWNCGESELADLFAVALARPLPSFVAVGGQLRVDELAGVAHAAEWQGLFIDANLRGAAAVSRTAADAGRVRGFFELAALEGSVLEHRLFEEEFGVAAISTARLLGLARAAGLPVLTLDAGNAGELLPTLDLDPMVAADITAAVAQGQSVRLPAAGVTQSAWSGTGYLKEHPATGEAGYMLSGGLAGGQTVLGRRDWPAELAAIMASPFTGEPNADPAQAQSLAAVTPWPIREATAGEPLDGTLAALVRDARGVAVAGAPVIFTVRSGGGWLVDDLLHPGERLRELTAVSGRDGMARARFVPGELTSDNPVVYVRAGDRHANLAGENLIDAELGSGSLARLAVPIAIFGFAGRPDPALSKAYGDNLRGEVFGYSGDALLLLRDRFGNPVANHAVTFTVQPVQPAVGSRCGNPPGLEPDRRNARLVADDACLQLLPVYGECGAAASVSVVSRSDGGARAGIILGGVPYARYPVTAAFATSSGTGSAAWFHRSEAFASCTASAAAPANRLVLLYQKRLDEASRNVDARPAGEPAGIQVKAALLAEGATILADGQPLSCLPLPDLTCDMVAGTGAFTLAAPDRVAIGGQPAVRAASMANSQALPYLYRGNVSLPLGLVNVAVEAAASRSLPRIVNGCAGCGALEPAATVVIGPEQRSVPIWGVELRPPETATVLVDHRGIAQRDLTFSFAIAPAQYVANYAQVLLWRNGELWDTLPAATSGNPAVTFPAGYWFDPRSNYELQVILNNAGEANEIRSRRIPLLQRTAAVDLRVDGLPDAIEDQVGAFVLLNNDFDERDADPAVSFPDAATPGLVETDDELKRAWLQIDASSGQGGTWQVRAGDPAKLRVFHRKDGVWVEFKPTDPPEPVTAFPAAIPLYLEGLAESTVLRGDTLTASFLPAGAVPVGDTVPVTMMKLDMAIDGNRDRKIVFDDSGDEAALFWVNNDRDYQHREDGQDVEDDAETGDNSVDAVIACKRDLEDFARLHLLLGAVAAPGPLTYTLQVAADDGMIQPMLNVFPAVNESDGYLGLPSDKATAEQSVDQLGKSLLGAVGRLPVNLSAASLVVKGVNPILFEGRMPGKGRLVLTANHQGVPVASRSVALELVDPTWLYDHFVVSQTTDKEDSPVRPAVNPEGMEASASRLALYRPANDEYVLFVHGWNMQPWEKRRWAETVFKRLWWQGYRGKVGLFDWPCRSLPSWDFLANFDRSEYIAWQSAPALKGVLEQLSGDYPGGVRLLAHSQGNVVAGEAIRLGDRRLVHTYVASQAALSTAFYDHIYPVVQNLTARTPEVMASYPDDPDRLPYLSRVAGKVGRLFNYYNTRDYALTGDSATQPTWLLNNRTRPDGSVGYGYQGDPSYYPPEVPDVGFYRNADPDGPNGGLLPLVFPEGRHEIFSYCAQSRACALGASNLLPLGTAGIVDLAVFGYDGEKSAHSRQFRSNVVAEQKYWQQFVRDAALSERWVE